MTMSPNRISLRLFVATQEDRVYREVVAAVNAEPDPSNQDIRELTNRRMSSLYVVDTASDNSPLVPRDRFTREDVGHLIDALIGRYNQLLYAEWLNAPRIGSRALFK